MIALDLDGAVFQRPAGAAQPFELSGEVLQLGLRKRYALDRSDRLAAASTGLTAHAHDAVAAGRNGLVPGGCNAADPSRVHDSVAWHSNLRGHLRTRAASLLADFTMAGGYFVAALGSFGE